MNTHTHTHSTCVANWSRGSNSIWVVGSRWLWRGVHFEGGRRSNSLRLCAVEQQQQKGKFHLSSGSQHPNSNSNSSPNPIRSRTRILRGEIRKSSNSNFEADARVGVCVCVDASRRWIWSNLACSLVLLAANLACPRRSENSDSQRRSRVLICVLLSCSRWLASRPPTSLVVWPPTRSPADTQQVELADEISSPRKQKPANNTGCL